MAGRRESVRVLLVEDDRKIASFIEGGLRQAGFAVDTVGDGEEGLLMAESNPYDAMVVDIMLPRMDGLTLIERLRGSGVQTPVLILSAKHTVDDKVRGFQTGGDDYLTKPFSFSELLARIRALIRRASQQNHGASALEVGDLRLDLVRRRVTRGGREIELQPREFSLLEYLMRNAGSVVSKAMILEHVWDYHFDPQTNVVDVLIHRLRNRIDRDFETKLIHTVRGVGYVLETA
jgi:two-component system OmpR family response regulator